MTSRFGSTKPFSITVKLTVLRKVDVTVNDVEITTELKNYVEFDITNYNKEVLNLERSEKVASVELFFSNTRAFGERVKVAQTHRKALHLFFTLLHFHLKNSNCLKYTKGVELTNQVMKEVNEALNK